MPQEEDFFKSENPNTEPSEEQEMPEPGKGKNANSTTRLLLLVLLLLVVGAAALFYIGPVLLEPEIAQTPAQPRKNEVVKLPAPEPAAKASPDEKTATVPEKGVVKEEIPEQPVVAVEKVDDVPQEKDDESAGAQETEDAGLVKKVAEETAAVSGGAGQYVLQVGAFLLESNLQSVETAVEKIGYQPRYARDTKNVEMTRLKLGSFDKESAQARLEEVRGFAPDAFYATGRDGQVNVYAGSFYSLDRARAFADRLFADGVRVEEERVEVELPVTIVRFGDFEDRREAEKVASLAIENGLDVAVLQNR